MATVRVPHEPGEYEVSLTAVNAAWPQAASCRAMLTLTVGDNTSGVIGGTAPLLEAAQAALAEAHRLQRLPDDYLDVTEGWFARGKRWLKHKLLGNFKKAYVDVLSRQQTRVNQQLVIAVEQLSQCCAALDHAARQMQARLDMLEETNAAGVGRFCKPSSETDGLQNRPTSKPHAAGEIA